GGDNFLMNANNTALYAQNVNEVVKRTTASTSSAVDSTWETQGYDNYKAWSGYTEGPGHRGKTFFVWPPHPRGPTNLANNCVNSNNGAKNWMQRFFIMKQVRNQKITRTFQPFTPPVTTTSGSGSSGSGSSTSGSSTSGSSTSNSSSSTTSSSSSTTGKSVPP